MTVLVRTKRHAILAFVLGIAALLRLHGLGDHGPYWDEIFQISVAAGSHLLEPVMASSSTFTQGDFWAGSTLANVLDAARSMFDPPLYAILLHWWMGLVGAADSVVRLLSVFVGVATVASVYWLAGLLFQHRVALVAAAIYAIHPLAIRFSCEARGRILATLFLIVATALLSKILLDRAGGPRPSLWLSLFYGFATAAALLSHYMAGFVLVGHAVCAMLLGRRETRWRVLVGWAVATIPFSLWIRFAASESVPFLMRSQPYLLELARTGRGPGGIVFPSTLEHIVAGTAKVVLMMGGTNMELLVLGHGLGFRWVLPLLLLPLGLGWLAWRGRKEVELHAGGAVLVAVMTVAPVIVLAILAWLSGHTAPFRADYAVFASPFLAIAMAAGMTVSRPVPGVAWGLLACVLVCMTVGLREIYADSVWRRPPNQYAALAGDLQRAIRDDDTVVYPTWADARILNLYLRARPVIRQRVSDQPGADAWLRATYGLPNTPQGTVAPLRPPADPIRVVDAHGHERLRFDRPYLLW